MTGEITPGDNSPDPEADLDASPDRPDRPAPGSGVAPGLRASHADRDRVVEILRAAAGDGRLTAAELDERLETALTARTVGELTVLTTDLPAVAGQPNGLTPQAKDLVRIDQRGGTVTRTGRWVVPRRMEIQSSFSDVTLDFTDAVITQDTLRIELTMRGGTLTLLTTSGIVVDTDDLTMSYAKLKIPPAAGSQAPVTLRVELVGGVGFGKVVVRPPRRTFLQRLFRESQP